jgi:Mg-chelatase subunit ChlD
MRMLKMRPILREDQKAVTYRASTAILSLLVAAGCSSTSTPVSSFDSGAVDAGHDSTTIVKPMDAGMLMGMEATTPDACAATSATAKVAPLDMVLLLDRSGSMAYNDSWIEEGQALTNFFGDYQSAGISVALLYMPIVADLCNPAAYAVPAVPMTALPGGAGELTTSIANTLPFGGSPITIGFEGAVAYAQQRQQMFPEHEVVIVYSTDAVGINSCLVVPDGGLPNTEANAVTVLTAAAALSPPIKTYVIGVRPVIGQPSGATGVALHGAASAFAVAGGTGSAFFVGAVDAGSGDGGSEAGAGGGAIVDIEGELITTFNAIREQALPCQYSIPQAAAGTINFSDVNVTFKPASGASQQFYGVGSLADCQSTTPDWYYDSQMQHVELCPNACAIVKAATNATVNVDYGCATIAPPK